jgi:hypothetical protein
LKIIIAHFAQGNVGDEEVYRAITKPGIYGDLSMLHGMGAGKFFADFRNWFKTNNIKERNTQQFNDKRDWSEYVLFASDYPYFGPQHAQGLLIYLFNQEFFSTGGTLKDTANILGLNQLKLLPEYSMGYTSQTPKFGSAIIHAPSQLSVQSLSVADQSIKTAKLSELRYLALAKLIEEKKMNIENYMIKMGEKFDTTQEDCLLLATFPQGPELIPIIVKNLVKDKLDFLGVMPQGETWRYDFFEKFSDPLTRSKYAKMFSQSWPAKNPSEAVDMIGKIVS